MNLYLPVFISILLLFSCNEPTSKQNTGNSVTGYNNATVDFKRTLPDYSQFKSAVAIQRKSFKKDSVQAIRQFLYKTISDDIFSYWEGTKWDFNGTVREPGKGEIACGYFITNTLDDLGFKLNRVKLAQGVSSKLIKTLCLNIRNFDSFSGLSNYLQSEPDSSVYIIGLDYHTGYILKDSTGIYFLHSNYINRVGVVKEKIDASTNLRSNRNFMIGNLSQNKRLLQEWIKS
ncbi:hypothetical protein [Polluticaenibacter yanchengensis]|uniref:Transglutaminase-like domain-containing protein n=1 Tax=Polluticaenibacter yanchengensis TaxID=3014562 RepID=A0ABT4UMZ7_9BACT|nr:hypothetical protein [Chitinophagaceae bacterium LY-5]